MAKQTALDVSEIAETTEGIAVLESADQLSGLGDKITDLGSSALDVFSDTENAVIKVNTYFAETGAEAEKSSAIV
ncbi:MAG: hypothetical protein ACK5LV_11085 [Lachnospirales bacterium]